MSFLPQRIQQLRDLIRARNDNPLVMYGRPGRSWRRALVFRAVVLAALGSALVQGYLLAKWELRSAPIVHCIILIGLSPFLPFLSLYVFGCWLRDRAHLEELEVTRVGRRAVAFGAAWWGVAVATLTFLPFYGISIVLELWQGFGQGPMNAFGRLVLPPVVFIYCLALTVQAWTDHGPKLLKTLAVTVVSHVLTLMVLYIGCAMLVLASMVVLTSRSMWNPPEWVQWMVVMLPFAGVAADRCWSATRFAGDRFFVPIDSETLARELWTANEREAGKEKRAQKAALRRFETLWRRDYRADWKGIGAGLALLVLAAGVGSVVGLVKEGSPEGSIQGALRGVFGIPSLLAACVYATVVSVLLRARGRDDTVLPAVAGSVVASVMRTAILPCLPFALLGLGCGFRDLRELGATTGEMLVALMAGGMSVLLVMAMMAAAVLMLLPRGRRRLVAALWMGGAAVFQFYPLLFMDDPHHKGSIVFYEIDVRGAFVYFLAGIGLMVWMYWGLFWSGQRLHERELRGLPRHTLTTDAVIAPSPGEEGRSVG